MDPIFLSLLCTEDSASWSLLDTPRDLDECLERVECDLEAFDLDDELEDEEDELLDPTLACTGFVVIQMHKANITSALRASFSEIWANELL